MRSQSAPPPLHPPEYYNGNLSPSMAVFLLITFGFFICIGFLVVYLRRYPCPFLPGRRRRNPPPPPPSEQQQSWVETDGVLHQFHAPTTPDGGGLSVEAIQGLPAFLFSDVKVHHMGKDELECAVCLNKFQDHEVLRLLPGCNHVFHPQCVDRWLTSRPTCPKCRANCHTTMQQQQQQHYYYSFIGIPLPSSSDSDHEYSSQVSNQNHDRVNIITTSYTTTTADQIESEPSSQEEEPNSNSGSRVEVNAAMNPPYSKGVKTLSRSHSTGQYLDRFTLRLPEQLILRDQLVVIPILNGKQRCGDDVQKVMSAASTPGIGYGKSDANGQGNGKGEEPDSKAKKLGYV